MDNHVFEQNSINYCGKLPNSSYYDKPNKIMDLHTHTLVHTTNLEKINRPHTVNSNDPNIFVKACVFSPNSTYVAWVSGFEIVKILKFQNSSNLRSFSFNETDLGDTMISNNFEKGDISEIKCIDNVKSLAFGSSDPQSHIERIHYRDRKANTRLYIHNNNLILAVGLQNGKITLYDVKSHSLIMHLYSHTDVINDLKFTRDGSLQLMSTSSDRTIKLWNIYQDGNMYHTFKGHTDKVNMCDWSPTAKMVVSAGLNRQAFIWDTNSFKLKHTLKGHLHNVSSCLFSPDGALVATSSYDTRILIWNPFSGVLVREFCHMLPPPRLIYAGGDNGAYIRDLSFSEAGDHVVSVCDDKKIRVWSMSTNAIVPVAVTEMTEVGLSCAYSSTHKTVIVGTRRGHVDVYKVHLPPPKLVNLCRLVINKSITSMPQADCELDLPTELKSFLLYNNIRTYSSVSQTRKNSMLLENMPISVI